MTNEYKINLLNYVINNITPTSQTSEEIFVEEENISKELWADYIPSNAYAVRYEGMIDGNENTSSLTILYGGWKNQNNVSFGLITLVDDNFIPIKTIYSFNSGTNLRYIQCMKQAEDGTFYFIDDATFSYNDGSGVTNSQKRFVMVNNFTILNQVTNDYEINLRKSYIFNSTFQNFYCKEIYKDPNSAQYIMFGQGATGTYSFQYYKIYGLKVEVGSSNEWTNYYSSSGDSYRLFGGAFAIFNNEGNISFRSLTCSLVNGNRSIDCISKTYDGNVTTNAIATFEYQPFIDSFYFNNQCVFTSMDKVYYVLNNWRWDNTVSSIRRIGLYLYDFNSNNNQVIYEKNLGNVQLDVKEAIYITKCKEDIYIQYNTNIVDYSSPLRADYYVQRLVNNVWNPILIGEGLYFYAEDRNIFVKNNFNLLQIILWCNNPENSDLWFQYQIKENYNSLNYNGEPYTDYNSIIPKQVEIYSNNKLVFARNLYNSTIYANMTMATVQIPNSYLNNINLDIQNLWGETNVVNVSNTETIQKNIYEVLLLNYINTINVIDEDENNTYPLVANYINSNINTGTQTNCEDTSIGKLRITKNGVSTIQPIYWQDIDNTHKKAEITLYINEMISTIEFISNDETTTYLTKDLSDLEVEKTYTITQYLRVE